MDKYIKAEDLIDRIYPVDPENDGSDGCTVVYKNLTLSSPEIEAILEELPAADVAEVRRGRWLTTDAYPHHLYCSVCYKTYAKNAKWVNELDLPTNYCPNCGARMGKEDEHEAD